MGGGTDADGVIHPAPTGAPTLTLPHKGRGKESRDGFSFSPVRETRDGGSIAPAILTASKAAYPLSMPAAARREKSWCAST
jgi:hypothetical protein